MYKHIRSYPTHVNNNLHTFLVDEKINKLLLVPADGIRNHRAIGLPTYKLSIATPITGSGAPAQMAVAHLCQQFLLLLILHKI